MNIRLKIFFNSDDGIKLSHLYNSPLIFTDIIIVIDSDDGFKEIDEIDKVDGIDGIDGINIGVKRISRNYVTNKRGFFTLKDFMSITLSRNGANIMMCWIYVKGFLDDVLVIDSKPVPSYSIYDHKNVIPRGMKGHISKKNNVSEGEGKGDE